MLSIKECEAKAKELGLYFEQEGSYRFILQAPQEFDEKAYKKWAKARIAYWKRYDKQQMDYYKKYNPQYLKTYLPLATGDQAKDPALKKVYLYELKHSNRENQLQLTEGTSTYSCAIEEFGGFTIGGKNKLYKHWDLLLQWFMNKTKYTYLKCATPVKPMYKDLRKALKEIGFEMRATEKSNHGKYKVEVWEYIKPQVKKKK